VSRKQVERSVDITETFAVDQAILPFSGIAFGLVEELPEVLARCFAIPRLVGATDNDVQASPARLAKIVALPCEKRVQLLQLDTNRKLRSLKGVRRELTDLFMESFEIYDTFLENLVDERAGAAKQLSRRLQHVGYHWCGVSAVRCSVCVPNLRALFVKLVRGKLGELSASVCHERELDAEREMGKRLELVVTGWYNLLTLFPVVAEERRIVANHHDHRDAIAELCQNLFDEPSVGHVEAHVNGRKRTVTRQEFQRFGQFTLRVWIRKLHECLTNRINNHIGLADVNILIACPRDVVFYVTDFINCIHRFHS